MMLLMLSTGDEGPAALMGRWRATQRHGETQRDVHPLFAPRLGTHTPYPSRAGVLHCPRAHDVRSVRRRRRWWRRRTVRMGASVPAQGLALDPNLCE